MLRRPLRAHRLAGPRPSPLNHRAGRPHSARAPRALTAGIAPRERTFLPAALGPESHAAGRPWHSALSSVRAGSLFHTRALALCGGAADLRSARQL